VYSVNRKYTEGMHIINKINIQNSKEDDIFNNHKTGKEDTREREHMDYGYLSDKSPICLKSAESNAYSHDDCGELPTQTLSRLTPEKPKSSHVSPPDPSESIPTPLKSLPSSPALCQSSSPSDLLPFSSESLDSELTSSRGGMMLDSDSELAVVLDDPVDSGD
jgi:hypothetical protein